MSSSDNKNKKSIASDEELMMKKKEDDEGGKVNLSFFDNTIDESENEQASKMDKEKPDMPSTSDSGVMKKNESDHMMHDRKNMMIDSDEMEQEHEKHVLTKTNNKSFMEMEVKRDKMRWLYMSELGAIFGEEKHTRDSFMKLFGTRVSLNCKKCIQCHF